MGVNLFYRIFYALVIWDTIGNTIEFFYLILNKINWRANYFLKQMITLCNNRNISWL